MAISDLTPNVAEVAAHLRVRTKDAHGQEVGTFNADTRPTADQVEALIATGVRRVAARVGQSICEGGDVVKQAELYADARDLAALRVALQIELSYFAEQVGSSRSPYEQLKALYDESIESLRSAIAAHCGGPAGGAIPRPAHSFPVGHEIIGRDTAW